MPPLYRDSITGAILKFPPDGKVTNDTAVAVSDSSIQNKTTPANASVTGMTPRRDSDNLQPTSSSPLNEEPKASYDAEVAADIPPKLPKAALSTSSGTSSTTTRSSLFSLFGLGNSRKEPDDVTPPSSRIFTVWFPVVTLSLGAMTWTLTKRVEATLVSMVTLPTVAIMQGSYALFKYRVKFTHCPVPKSPSHGIVKCEYGPSSIPRYTVQDPHYGPHTDAPPLRLLVIGDSLAIGVGQTTCATPIMPEAIAKTLSKAMGGRPVLWTCHGAPGASTGWIVRELERSMKGNDFLQASDRSAATVMDLPNAASHSSSCRPGEDSTHGGDSSSDESSDQGSFSHAGLVEGEDEEVDEEERQTWTERLRQERVHFDPQVVGPFDIAVVLTGSNDLKCTFFPFMLTGEDAELRRQAQLRGGGYGLELARLLEALNQRMRSRLQTLREKVESARETFRDARETFRERLGSGDVKNRGTSRENMSSVSTAAMMSSATESFRADEVVGLVSDGGVTDHGESSLLGVGMESSTDSMQYSSDTAASPSSPLFPMVVLPGLPSRSMPIFEPLPLHWLAVPIVDRLDSHKKKLACQHRGEVLFVDAPQPKDLTEYSMKEGAIWQQKQEDHVLLNLKDIKRKHASRIEAAMEEYCVRNNAAIPNPESLPLRKRHHSVLSVDGVHANDVGYDFWGRFIATSIVQEWERKQQQSYSSFQGENDTPLSPQ